jgi:oxygen-independent coproporphyrinogen-3 oxidase
VAGRDDLLGAYLDAIERELRALGTPQPVDTLFLGGGTPSHLPPAPLSRLVRTVRHWFPLETGGEFSIEANPSDVHPPQIELLAELGITRISLGAQSFDPDKLRRLDRDHGAADIARSISLARRHLHSVAIDLIFGVPGESLEIWRADLDAALEWDVDHVSTYGLTYERGTALWTRRRKGQVRPADEELERAMFGEAIDRLEAAGFEHYEVSNFARPGQRCRHNEVYWAADEYFAVGPGAARYVGGRREVNHRSTTTYIRRVLSGQSPVAESEVLGAEDRAREALVLGLRRMPGVARAEFARRTGFTLDALVGPELHQHTQRGHLSDDGSRVRLTREGLYVSDSIWPDLLRV